METEAVIEPGETVSPNYIGNGFNRAWWFEERDTSLLCNGIF